MCSDVTYKSESLYLVTPNFPDNFLSTILCSCMVTGQNVSITIIQHMKVSNSPVVMIIATDTGTRHVNDINVLNRQIEQNAHQVELFVHNEVPDQLFKLWTEFIGHGQ